MFTETWKKYLAVIRILLKRSLHADQTLGLNESDFQRGTGKKIKFACSFVLVNGRVSGSAVSQLERDFIAVLLQDDFVNEFLRKKTVMFTLTSNFQLQIKNITPPADAELREREANITSNDPQKEI